MRWSVALSANQRSAASPASIQFDQDPEVGRNTSSTAVPARQARAPLIPNR
jgi:hypothetical protein